MKMYSGEQMTELRFLPPAAKFLKKLKDKRLKKLYKDAIDAIMEDPGIGSEKTGDLAGIRGYDIYYQKTNYELAYTVEYIQNNDGEKQAVIVIMAGTRENFYDELKRYLNK